MKNLYHLHDSELSLLTVVNVQQFVLLVYFHSFPLSIGPRKVPTIEREKKTTASPNSIALFGHEVV
jgi:hypothetical protein